MKVILIFGIIMCALGAALPPIDTLTYICIGCVAVNAFLLGVDVGAG